MEKNIKIILDTSLLFDLINLNLGNYNTKKNTNIDILKLNNYLINMKEESTCYVSVFTYYEFLNKCYQDDKVEDCYKFLYKINPISIETKTSRMFIDSSEYINFLEKNDDEKINILKKLYNFISESRALFFSDLIFGIIIFMVDYLIYILKKVDDVYNKRISNSMDLIRKNLFSDIYNNLLHLENRSKRKVVEEFEKYYSLVSSATIEFANNCTNLNNLTSKKLYRELIKLENVLKSNNLKNVSCEDIKDENDFFIQIFKILKQKGFWKGNDHLNEKDIKNDFINIIVKIINNIFVSNGTSLSNEYFNKNIIDLYFRHFNKKNRRDATYGLGIDINNFFDLMNIEISKKLLNKDEDVPILSSDRYMMKVIIEHSEVSKKIYDYFKVS